MSFCAENSFFFTIAYILCLSKQFRECYINSCLFPLSFCCSYAKCGSDLTIKRHQEKYIWVSNSFLVRRTTIKLRPHCKQTISIRGIYRNMAGVFVQTCEAFKAKCTQINRNCRKFGQSILNTWLFFFYTKIHILDILRSVYSEAIVAMVAAPADSVVVAVIQLRSNFIFVQNCKILLISSFIPLISRVWFVFFSKSINCPVGYRIIKAEILCVLFNRMIHILWLFGLLMPNKYRICPNIKHH